MAVQTFSERTASFQASDRERPFPEQPAPRVVAENLVRAGVMRDYFLYERQGEARIAGGCLAKVSVTADDIRLDLEGAAPYSEPARDPFKQVEHLLESLPIPTWTAYGYVSFDMSKFYHPYSRSSGCPLLQFIIPRFEIRFAHDRVSILNSDTLSKDELRRLRDLIAQPSLGTNDTPTPPVLDFEDRQDYCLKVKTLTAAIRAGELQKAILSRCAHVPGTLDFLGTYAAAARVNNASRSYCFRMDDVGAVGFSPEILLEGDGRGLMTTNPLAGTRPRGADPSEDERLRGELFTDAKEVKEHALSVLLAQEEMGSVCARDSVRVYDFMEVKKFRCVQHLSSRVSGRLSPGHTLWDALRALFPGVTVSGIAKSQALQWISELEGEPRGIYGGAVGWIDSQGRADLAIAIRSAFQYGNMVHLNAGAGIVAESLPEREYIESVNKMNTMLSQIVMQRPESRSYKVEAAHTVSPSVGPPFFARPRQRANRTCQ